MGQFLYQQHPGFYCAAERPPDVNAECPFAVFEDNQVLDASPSAQTKGVKIGIPKKLALRRCPGLEWVEHDPDACRPLYHRLWSIYAKVTPLVEPQDLHSGYVNLTGCLRGKSFAAMIEDLFWRVRFQTGLTLQWGGGQDRWISRLAAGTNRWIDVQDEQAFLRQTPLNTLLAADLCERLLRYGIRSIADFLTLPSHFLEQHLQLSSRQLESLFFRDRTAVQALYPPPERSLVADVDDSDPQGVEHAIEMLSVQAQTVLDNDHMQAGLLRVEFTTRSRRLAIEHKTTKPISTARQIHVWLQDQVITIKTTRLRHIQLLLKDLLPRRRTQQDLWQTRISDRDQRLDQVRETLARTYGFQTLENGSDLARRSPQRFAQLVWKERGLYLP